MTLADTVLADFNCLTERQAEVLSYLVEFVVVNGQWPSYREIMTGLGFSNTNSITCHVKALEKKGVLKRPQREARAWAITGWKLTLVRRRPCS